MVPWQPPSIWALVGSHSTAKPPASSSGRSRPIRPSPLQLGSDLLVVVEDPGDVPLRRIEGGRTGELDRHAALHVTGASPPDLQLVALAPGPVRHVAGDRHRVQVARDHHPVGTAELGPGHHDVAVADHLEMPVRTQCRLDRVGDLLLAPTDRLDVDQGREQLDRIAGQVEHRSGLFETRGLRRRFGHAGHLTSRRYPRRMSSPAETTRSAAAWGVASVHDSGTLDAWFPAPQLGSEPGAQPAELASLVGEDAVRGVRTELVVGHDRPGRRPGRHRGCLPAAAPAQPPPRPAAFDQPGRPVRRAAQRGVDLAQGPARSPASRTSGSGYGLRTAR